jgi:hypothetical protein
VPKSSDSAPSITFMKEFDSTVSPALIDKLSIFVPMYLSMKEINFDETHKFVK